MQGLIRKLKISKMLDSDKIELSEQEEVILDSLKMLHDLIRYEKEDDNSCYFMNKSGECVLYFIERDKSCFVNYDEDEVKRMTGGWLHIPHILYGFLAHHTTDRYDIFLLLQYYVGVLYGLNINVSTCTDGDRGNKLRETEEYHKSL